jgi:hypothetical protein
MPGVAPPKKKPVPWDLPLLEQHQLLTQPETNPTGYEPLERAQDFAFQPRSNTYSRVNAWWLAEASWLAYWKDANAVARLFHDRAGMTCELVAVNGAEAYVATAPTFAIVAFRGTQPDDWEDILDDACFATVQWDAGYVHDGFARRLGHLNEEMQRRIGNLPADCPVWFTGHSLGAAVATLAAYRHRAKTGGVYTFGSPLVGNAIFSGSFADIRRPSYRYVNDHDVVTRVPPAPFAIPNGLYTHVADMRWIDKEGNVGTAMPSLSQFVRTVFGSPRAILDVVELHAAHALGVITLRRQPTLPDSLRDHSPLYYVLHCWNDFATHFAEPDAPHE